MHVQLRRSHLPHAGGECFGRRLLDVWRFGGIVWSDALSLGCGLDVPLDKSFWCARTNTGPDHPNAAFGDPSVPFPLQKTQTRTVGFQMRKVDTHARDARDTRVAVKPATSEAARSSIRGHGCTLSGWPSPWERRAAQSRQMRLKEAHGLSWGTA